MKERGLVVERANNELVELPNSPILVTMVPSYGFTIIIIFSSCTVMVLWLIY